MSQLRFLPTLVFCALALVAARSETVADSGERRVALIELFTSEGCSSCPPAEHWLNGLRTSGGLWKDFVPVAFHVDYWDNLGWPDRFASPEFTARQRTYADHWNAPSVYTPGFVVNGQEWRGSRDVPKASDDSPGRMTIERTGQEFLVRFQPRGDFAGGTAHVALLGNDLSSDVRRGENAGRELKHEFIALTLVEGTLTRAEGQWTATLKLPALGTKPALAAWVTTGESPTPIQAAGGWLTTP